MSASLTQLFAFLEATPNEPFLLFAIAKEYEGLKDDENTKLYYEKLMVEHESYVGTYYHLGKFYERQNQISEAIETYKKGMEVAKAAGEKHAWGELSTAKMMIDDEDEF
jgi:tetratricopeptide (TPR) repeat protein